MKGRWKIIIILLVFVVKNKGDTMNELLISVKNLHDKVDKIGMEQVKTHEKVEQLQMKLNQLSLNVKSMPEMDFNEKIATTTSSLTTLNKKILEMDEKMDKANEAFLQKFEEIIGGTSKSTTTTLTPSKAPSVIMITGGLPLDKAGKSVELLYPNGTQMCELKSLPDKRFHHTQSGLITCGGSWTKDTCLIFHEDGWKWHGSTLKPRYYHSSFKYKDTTLLIGGHNDNTTEILEKDVTQRMSFQLLHPTVYACVIDLDYKFLVTGGAYPGDRKQVTKYDYVSGFVRKMPGLNGKGRSHHGCGQFINNENQQVFIVAGGYDGSLPYLSSTEMLIGEDATEWTWGAELPSRRIGLRGVSVANRFLLTGGESNNKILDEVLMLTKDGKNWTKTTMKYARENHAVSLVPEDIKNYCQ